MIWNSVECRKPNSEQIGERTTSGTLKCQLYVRVFAGRLLDTWTFLNWLHQSFSDKWLLGVLRENSMIVCADLALWPTSGLASMTLKVSTWNLTRTNRCDAVFVCPNFAECPLSRLSQKVRTISSPFKINLEKNNFVCLFTNWRAIKAYQQHRHSSCSAPYPPSISTRCYLNMFIKHCLTDESARSSPNSVVFVCSMWTNSLKLEKCSLKPQQ